jgi:hypothetical protein
MPNIPVGFAQVNQVFNLTGDSQEMMCTFGLDLNAAEGTDNLAIVNAFMTNFANRFKAFMFSSYSLTRADGRFNRGAGIVSQSTSLAAIPATGGDQPLPQNCAYLVHKFTAAGGRTGKGRFYLPGSSEGVVDALGNVGASTKTAFNTAAALFLTDIEAIIGVNSLTLLHSLVADIPNTIVSIVIDDVIGTQRRRLR